MAGVCWLDAGWGGMYACAHTEQRLRAPPYSRLAAIAPEEIGGGVLLMGNSDAAGPEVSSRMYAIKPASALPRGLAAACPISMSELIACHQDPWSVMEQLIRAPTCKQKDQRTPQQTRGRRSRWKAVLMLAQCCSGSMWPGDFDHAQAANRRRSIGSHILLSRQDALIECAMARRHLNALTSNQG